MKENPEGEMANIYCTWQHLFTVISHDVIHGDPKLMDLIVVTGFQLNSSFLIKYSRRKTWPWNGRSRSKF